MKSQSDLTSFGVGVISGIKAHFRLLKDFPYLSLSAQESDAIVSSKSKVSVQRNYV